MLLRYCCFLNVLALVNMAEAIYIIGLDMPRYVTYGDSVELACLYELQDDVLYAVKWYKDEQEFFRHVQHDWPHGQYIQMDGVTVDLDNSNAISVYLINVTFKTGGIYRCEVSTDAPSFATVAAAKYLNVAYWPEEASPTLTTMTRFYKMDETAQLECSTSGSRPAAQISWSIHPLVFRTISNPNTANQSLELANDSFVVVSARTVISTRPLNGVDDTLESTQSTLKMLLNQRLVNFLLQHNINGSSVLLDRYIGFTSGASREIQEPRNRDSSISTSVTHSVPVRARAYTFLVKCVATMMNETTTNSHTTISLVLEDDVLHKQPSHPDSDLEMTKTNVQIRQEAVLSHHKRGQGNLQYPSSTHAQSMTKDDASDVGLRIIQPELYVVILSILVGSFFEMNHFS
ncbi:hypothetical protein GZH46_01156 [Fragariocoptes setiger]|uniref:Ig-like domain-containing protein n=1 Tax=Fragariocoptes setiger TaxID=1670756 RepID=A0ABQ7SA82_9ACAR|nr:hypothetical protein GZH46_01156 [Fragariocoptes setiger]